MSVEALAPGMYPGIPLDAYLEQPAVSASLLHTVIDECPYAAWFESWLNPKRRRAASKASDAGSIAHEILLEGSADCCVIVDPEQYRSKPTKANPEGNPADGWNNDAVKARRTEILALGKIPVLKPDMPAIENMADSAWHFIESLKNTEPAIWAAFQPDGGMSEVSCLWDDDGVLCRMRPDRISNDRKLIVDPKFSARTTEPATWARTQMTPMGYWITAAMYRRGCQRTFGTSPDYIFLVVGQNDPHLCSLVGVDPAGFEHGASQVERGLRTWRECVERGWWPGYPQRVCYPEVKPWEFAEEQERAGIAPDGVPYDIEKLYERRAA